MNRSVSTGNLLGIAIRNNTALHSQNSANMNNNGMASTPEFGSHSLVNDISTTVKIGIRQWQNSNQNAVLNFLYTNSGGVALKNYIVEGPLIVGYVSNRMEAERIMKCDGMTFEGNRLKIEIMSGRVPSTSNTVEFLRNVVLKRYDPQNKMLNLENLAQDQDLIQNGMMSNTSTRSRTIPALIKIASEEPEIIIESINFANNQLKDITSITTLPDLFPRLKNLCLANNHIARTSMLDNWRNKLRNLRELLMMNNPLVKYYNYKNDMLKVFPKLIMLDNIVVRDQNKLNSIFNFPIKIQQFFFETAPLSNIGGQFVTQFLTNWDNNRQQLLNLYTPDSQFSMSVDATVPSGSVPKSDQNPAFGYYITQSRNMTKITNDKTRQQRLAKGSAEIAQFFNKFPITKHHLEDDPMGYKMEAVSYPQLNGIMVTLHGYFEEIDKPIDKQQGNDNNVIRTSQRSRRYASSYTHTTNSTSNMRLTKKSFDRIWILVPINNINPNGGINSIIASEMVTIRPYSSNSWSQATNPQQPSQGSTQLPTPPSTSSGLQIPTNINLNPIQLGLINKLHEVTKLNYQFTFMLAEQSNWNFDLAVKNFQTSVNNLPKEAFL